MSEPSQSKKSGSCLIKGVSLLLGFLSLVFCSLGALMVYMSLVMPVTTVDGTQYRFEGILSSAWFFIPGIVLFAAACGVWLVSRRRNS